MGGYSFTNVPTRVAAGGIGNRPVPGYEWIGATSWHANPEFYALTPNAEWIVHVSWVNDKWQTVAKIQKMHDASLNLHAAIASPLGIDASGGIVFSAEVVRNDRARKVIGRFDTDTKEFTILGDGYGQALVPKSNEILFFKYNEGLATHWIYVARIEKGKSLADERKLFPLESYTRLVPVRDYGAAFYDYGTKKGYAYVVGTGEVKEIRSDCACMPVAYRAATNEWVCGSPTTIGHYFLVDERGRRTAEFSLGTHVVPIVYLDGRDSMLFSRVETSGLDVRERISVYEYRFKDGSERLIGRDVGVSPRSISRKD